MYLGESRPIHRGTRNRPALSSRLREPYEHTFPLNSAWIRGNRFYCVDTSTGKRTSLRTADENAAMQEVEAKNIAERQPMINRQIAKAYLAGSDSGINSRTWQNAMDSIIGTKKDANRKRWQNAAKDQALETLLPQVIVDTQAETLLNVLQRGTVSTNVFLRRLHNFCVDLNWLPWPLITAALVPDYL